MSNALSNHRIMEFQLELIEVLVKHGTQIELGNGAIADLKTPLGVESALQKMFDMSGNHAISSYEHNGLNVAISNVAKAVFDARTTERDETISTTAGLASVLDIMADMDEEMSMEEAEEPIFD